MVNLFYKTVPTITISEMSPNFSWHSFTVYINIASNSIIYIKCKYGVYFCPSVYRSIAFAFSNA